MSTRKSESIFVTKRWWFLGGVVMALVLIAVLASSRKSGLDSKSTRLVGGGAVASGIGAPVAPSIADPHEAGAPRATRSSLNRSSINLEAEASQFAEVQQILADATLSEHDAAVALLGIVRRTDRPEAERDEALAHGLNLDFKAFTSLATDPSLPLPLAQRYFDELANRNELPEQQIEGCLGLMGRGEEGLRLQATRQLAFLLENEALADTPEELRGAALERIEILKAGPPALGRAGTEDAPTGRVAE